MTSNNNLLEIWLSENKTKFIKDFNIKYKSWLKAGGVVKTFITPNNETDCIKLIKFFHENKFAFYVLGNISNIIIRDGIINTPIINLHKLSDIFEKRTHEELKLKVNAGTSIIKLSKLIVCVFPVHPRTKKLLKRFSLIENLENENNLIITNPLGYIDFMSIQKRASVVITDSGGIQEESTYFGVPCLTVRNSTERPITVNQGTNKIIGTSYKNIIHEVELILSNTFKRKGIIPELWDGHASNRINDIFRSIII